MGKKCERQSVSSFDDNIQQFQIKSKKIEMGKIY